MWAPTRPAPRASCLRPRSTHLVETIHERSRGQSKQATGAAANNLDLYQVNCTFFDALGGRESEYLIARALQFFAPGIPQVYYVGLLGGRNDMELLARTGVGRDINRHYYKAAEIEAALARPLVQKQIELIRFRNTHPAFAGDFRGRRSGRKPDTNHVEAAGTLDKALRGFVGSECFDNGHRSSSGNRHVRRDRTGSGFVRRGILMNTPAARQRNLTAIKWLTFLMFMMFAMTTDSVGIIIPEVIKQFMLSMVGGRGLPLRPHDRDCPWRRSSSGILRTRSAGRRPSFSDWFCLR